MRGWLFVLIILGANARALPADESVTQGKKPAPPPASTRHGGIYSQPPSSAPETYNSYSSSTGGTEANERSPFSVNFHSGLTFQSEDPDVLNTWTHDIWHSYLFSMGGHYNLQPWHGLSALAGLDFSYLHSEEQITSDIANSYLSSDTIEFLATIGVGWTPGMLDNRAGATLRYSYPIWDQRSAGLNAHGFSRDLGSRTTRTGVLGLDFFYDIDHHWKPFIGYEYRVGSIMTLGVNYAF